MKVLGLLSALVVSASTTAFAQQLPPLQPLQPLPVAPAAPAVPAAPAADLNDLYGSYRFIAADQNEKPAKADLALADGTLTISSPVLAAPEVIQAKFESGWQDDFGALVNGAAIPAGMTFYKTALDVQGNGQLTPVTIVRQTANDTDPRLTVYIVDQGQAYGILAAYDAKQDAAYDQAYNDAVAAATPAPAAPATPAPAPVVPTHP